MMITAVKTLVALDGGRQTVPDGGGLEPGRSFVNSIGSFLHHLCIDAADRWYPLLSVFYLNYPCLELGQFAGNLFAEPDLHRLRQAGAAKFGPQPDCDTRCHSACALGFSRLLANPLSALHEAVCWGRGLLKPQIPITKHQ